MTFPLLNIAGIPFGNVTVAALILVTAVLLLCGLIQLGIMSIKFLLAADDENAPDMAWKNWLWEKVGGFIYKQVVYKEYETKVVKYDDGWVVLSPRDCTHQWYYTKKGNKGYCTDHNIRVFCKFDSKEDAVILSRAKYNNLKKDVIIAEFNNSGYKLAGGLFLLDLSIISLSIAFLQTLIILGLITIVYGVRSLAKRMYKGFKTTKTTTDDHEKRIVDLEK